MELASKEIFNKLNNSVSEELFNFRWSDYFPLHLGEYTVELARPEENLKFIFENKEALFKGNPSFFQEGFSESKQRYYQKLTDHFKFVKHGQQVGACICNITDWTSYYLRFCLIEKKHQKHGLQTFLFENIKKILATKKVSKIEGDVFISNKAQITSFMKNNWIISGCTNHEVYGTFVRMVSYLQKDREESFNKSFCFTNPTQGELEIKQLT